MFSCAAGSLATLSPKCYVLSILAGYCLVFFVAFILFAFNFLLIAWHINAKLIDADFVTMTRDFLDVFDFNFSFVSTVFVSFFEIISPILILSAIFSLTGVVYIGKRINFYQLSGI